MIVADRPYFALHYWNGRELITHFDTAEDARGPRPLHPKRQP